jgi:hypothetical protein
MYLYLYIDHSCPSPLFAPVSQSPVSHAIASHCNQFSSTLRPCPIIVVLNPTQRQTWGFLRAFSLPSTRRLSWPIVRDQTTERSCDCSHRNSPALPLPYPLARAFPDVAFPEATPTLFSSTTVQYSTTTATTVLRTRVLLSGKAAQMIRCKQVVITDKRCQCLRKTTISDIVKYTITHRPGRQILAFVSHNC